MQEYKFQWSYFFLAAYFMQAHINLTNSKFKTDARKFLIFLTDFMCFESDAVSGCDTLDEIFPQSISRASHRSLLLEILYFLILFSVALIFIGRYIATKLAESQIYASGHCLGFSGLLKKVVLKNLEFWKFEICPGWF